MRWFVTTWQSTASVSRLEGRRAGGTEGGKVGWREGGTEGRREGGREGGRQVGEEGECGREGGDRQERKDSVGGREEGREEGREGGREAGKDGRVGKTMEAKSCIKKTFQMSVSVHLKLGGGSCMKNAYPAAWVLASEETREEERDSGRGREGQCTAPQTGW